MKIQTTAALAIMAIAGSTQAQLLNPSFETPGFPDVFNAWGQFGGNINPDLDELILEFWKRSEHPVHCALLGAALARNMTRGMQSGRSECLARAGELESWATGLMGVLPTQASAARILAARVDAWSAGPLIDLAMQLEMKQFLSHKTCQALMDAWWRGGFPGGPGGFPADAPKDHAFECDAPH